MALRAGIGGGEKVQIIDYFENEWLHMGGAVGRRRQKKYPEKH